MSKLIIEIPPITEQDHYYIQERTKPSFNYPLHKHNAYELNFVEHGSGARRIVGDSFEVTGEYDLALIGCNLEHVWEQHECKSASIHEVTIQMPPNLFPEPFLNRRVMTPVKTLLEDAQRGVSFGMKAIMTVYSRLVQLTKTEASFESMQLFHSILFDLATSEDYHILASSHYSHADLPAVSRRIQKIKDYIDVHFAEEIRMEVLSDMVGMTPNALSRFFKQRTNRPVSGYINEVRLGHASQLLVETTMNVAEISSRCGFNTISNFNRLFRQYKGMTPKEFRESYKKNSFMI